MRVAFFQATSCHGDRTRTSQVCQAWSSQVSKGFGICDFHFSISFIWIIKIVTKTISNVNISIPPPKKNLGSLFFPVSNPGSDNSLLQVWASARTLLGHSQAEHTAVQQLRFTFSVVKVTITIFPSVIMWSTKYAIFASYRGCCKCDGQFNQYSARLLARCKVWLKKRPCSLRNCVSN